MKKIESSPFDPFVKWFFPKLLPLVPKRMTANHVSMAGHLCSALAFFCCVFSRFSRWLLVAAAFFVMSMVTGEGIIMTIGPTEVHIVAATATLLQGVLDFGKPWRLTAFLTGDDGLVTQWLGWERGMTFIDVAGFAGLAGIILIMVFTLRESIQRCKRLDV